MKEAPKEETSEKEVEVNTQSKAFKDGYQEGVKLRVLDKEKTPDKNNG